MHITEKFFLSVRHYPLFENIDWIWDQVRPLYNRVVSWVGRKGLQRVINGTDLILIAPQFRQMGEVYEPEVWQSLMSEVRLGDTVADVGAFIGLYTLALGQRVGRQGKVVAFEPDPRSYLALQEHVRLNQLEDRVQLKKVAVGAVNGSIYFDAQGITGHVTTFANSVSSSIECVTLDSVFSAERLDILKIDVEGYEEQVLRGATRVLSDEQRRPRVIFIEVHPYAWSEVGTTSDSLLGFLSHYGYTVETVEGNKVDTIAGYGEVIARDLHHCRSD